MEGTEMAAEDKTIAENLMNSPKLEGTIMSNKTVAKYMENISLFLDTIIATSPDYIVPVEKKGCKLLRSSQLAEKDISDKIRYLQYFENNNVSLSGLRIAVVDDAAKYTSMLFKYRKYFESKGAIVSTYSFIGQNMLKTAEREQYDPKAFIMHYLDESTYQEYILQQPHYLSADENFFDIDHIVTRANLSLDRYEKLLASLNSIGEIEFTNDIYTPNYIEKISLFNFKLPSAESMFPTGVSAGALQKVRFAYNKHSENITIAPLSFPIWDSNVVSEVDVLFDNIPFMLPNEVNESIKDKGVYFNICYAFHLHLLKTILDLLEAFPELRSFTIETQDLSSYVGIKRSGSIANSAKEYLLSKYCEIVLATPHSKMTLPQKKNTSFKSMLEIMQELRVEYDALVKEAKTLLNVRYFLSYEEIISRYCGRASLMKWIDILCDRGVLVARDCESNGVFYRACRSGEGDYDHIEKKSYALLPVAINACGRVEKHGGEEFSRITPLYLNKVLANLVYDYPKEDYDFHAFFTKPHHFGPLTYLKSQLEDEIDVPIYNADQISKYCTYDDKKKEFVAYSSRTIRKQNSQFFGQNDVVPYTEITSYLGFLKYARDEAGKDDFLNSLAICRDEGVYYSHVHFNIMKSYSNIYKAYQNFSEYMKERFLREAAKNINSALNKMKYEQDKILSFLHNDLESVPMFDTALEKITGSFVPFSESFVSQRIPAMNKVLHIELLITNLMLFDTLFDSKFLRKFIREYKKQDDIVVEHIEYYESIALKNKSEWSASEFQDYRSIAKESIDTLLLMLKESRGGEHLPDPRKKNYILQQRRQTTIYATNKASRYIEENELMNITILHYGFSEYRNLEGQRNINVIAVVQERVADIIATQMNAKIIYGATGSEEQGTLIFDSFQSALDFASELKQVFSSKPLNQISFRFGCSFGVLNATASTDEKNEQIIGLLKDAAKCATFDSRANHRNRLLISNHTKEQLPDSIDHSLFTEVRLDGANVDGQFCEYKLFDTPERVQKSIENTDESVKIGIVTVLLSEHRTVYEMLTDVVTKIFPSQNFGRHQFQIGKMKAFGGGEHSVALTRTLGDGNNKAAISASHLLEHFPNLKVILMVGIAGGTPVISRDSFANDLDIIEKHVRLGDIVVSDSIIQYDYVKKKFTEVVLKGQSTPPSAELVQAKNSLDEGAERGEKPWEAYIAESLSKLSDDYKRPDESFDVLFDYDGGAIAHPVDGNRTESPYVFSGKIASSNAVLKDPKKRDELKREHNVYAIEMEASGIADATWEAGIGYYVVRGISDYCDSHKNNKWHKYSSLAAAAYAKALIEKIPI
jgi:nucleoside phosphorylase